MLLVVLIVIPSSAAERVPEGVGVRLRSRLLGLRAIDKLASLARAVASSALESLGIRRKEPKMKAMRKEPRAMKV